MIWNNYAIRVVCLAVAFVVIHTKGLAVDYTWTGAGGDNKWSNAGNWNPSSGHPQYSSDNAIFNSGNITCNIDETVSINAITVDGYTGTINQNGFSLTFNGLGASAFNSGTFSGGSGNMLFKTTLSITGSAKFISTSGLLRIQGNFTYSSSNVFEHHNGTISFYQPVIWPLVIDDTSAASNFALHINDLLFEGASGAQYLVSTAGLAVNNLTIDAQDASRLQINAGQSITVKGTFKTSGNFTDGYIMINNTIHAQGDIVIDNTGKAPVGTTGSGTIIVNGTGAQNFSSLVSANEGQLPNITIDKSSGTVGLSGILSVTGNWSYARSGGVTANASSMVLFKANYLTIDSQGLAAGDYMAFHDLTISNDGNAQAYLAGDLYINGDLTIDQKSRLYASSAYTITIAGDWDVSASDATFFPAESTVKFTGTNQMVSFSGSTLYSPANHFYNLTVAGNASTRLTFNSPVFVDNALTMTNGVINTTSANMLTLIDGATASGGSTATTTSFVDGPVKKVGNDTFTFPLGDFSATNVPIYRPLRISAPGLNNDEFVAQYFNVDATPVTGTSMASTLLHRSRFEYWKLDRTNGSSNVDATISWDTNDYSGGPYITNPLTLRVAFWNNTQWSDLGGISTSSPSGTGLTGTTTTEAPMTSFGIITLGSTTDLNPLPVTISIFKAKYDESAATVHLSWTTVSEHNNAYFILERSKNAYDFEFAGKINAIAGPTGQQRKYAFSDTHFFKGTSYYRLTQVDLDGTSEVVGFTAVHIAAHKLNIIFPNPGNGEFVNILLAETLEYTHGLHLYVVGQDGARIVRDYLPAHALDRQIVRYAFKEKLTEGVYFVVLVSDVVSLRFKYFVYQQ